MTSGRCDAMSARIGDGKKRDRRCSQRGREMRKARVDANRELGVREERRNFGERQERRDDRGSIPVREPAAARLFIGTSPWQHRQKARVRASFEHRAPMGFGPHLVVAARRVQHDEIGTLRNARSH